MPIGIRSGTIHNRKLSELLQLRPLIRMVLNPRNPVSYFWVYFLVLEEVVCDWFFGWHASGVLWCGFEDSVSSSGAVEVSLHAVA